MAQRLDDEYPIRPFADPADFERTAEWLRETGFTTGILRDELGIEDTTPPGSVEGSALVHGLSGSDPKHLLLRLFVLGQPLSAGKAAEALGPVAPERWRETGILVDDPGGFRCPVRLLPLPGETDGWCVGDASDSYSRPDFVMCPTGISATLAQLMLRRPAGSLLDLGTGTGYLAVIASRFAESVVATDLCPRALPLTRFNAMLNGCGNVEALVGSLYEPVGDRRFDRIVANPPFILGPGSGHMYRDAGGTIDGIPWQMARGAPGHLEEGGLLHMPLHWPLRRGEESAPLFREWLGGLGCDAWVMILARLSAADYVRTNASEVHYLRSPEFVAEYVRGIEYFSEAGVDEIGAGLLTLRKRSDAENWLHVEEAPRFLGPVGEDLARLFDARDLVREDRDGSRLLAACPTVAQGLELHQLATLGEDAGWETRSAEFRRTRGLAYVGKTDPVAAGILARCDGSVTTAELIEGLARSTGQPAASLRDPVMAAMRTMIELGFLLL